MATKVVKNSATGTMGVRALKRSRYEKAEIAYGKIPAAAYTIDTDTLAFFIPAKELIHAKFIFDAAGTPQTLEVFSGADLSSALSWDVSTGTEATIDYVIQYIRGTGSAHPGLAAASTESTGEYGINIQITPIS